MRRGIVVPATLVTVGLSSLAACGGGTTNTASKSSTTTTSASGGGQGQSTPGGSTGTGGSTSSGGISGSAGSGSGGGSTGSGGGGGSQAKSPNVVNKPLFTSAAGSPSSIPCPSKGASSRITVSWATKNATSVSASDGGPGNQPPSGSFAFDGCSRKSVTLVAHGPGGDASVTVSWTYTAA